MICCCIESRNNRRCVAKCLDKGPLRDITRGRAEDLEKYLQTCPKNPRKPYSLAANGYLTLDGTFYEGQISYHTNPNILALPACASMNRSHEDKHHCYAQKCLVRRRLPFSATRSIPSAKRLSYKARSEYRWVMTRRGKAVVKAIHSCIVRCGFGLVV